MAFFSGDWRQAPLSGPQQQAQGYFSSVLGGATDPYWQLRQKQLLEQINQGRAGRGLAPRTGLDTRSSEALEMSRAEEQAKSAQGLAGMGQMSQYVPSGFSQIMSPLFQGFGASLGSSPDFSQGVIDKVGEGAGALWNAAKSGFGNLYDWASSLWM